MTHDSGPTITFDRFEVDVARGELRRDGASVAVEPQVLDLIAHISGRPGEVVSRDDLIDAVWTGRIVSDSAISSCIAAARTALGDDGKTQRFIRTIPRRGIRFDGAQHQATGDAARLRAQPALPDKPSVAVLPFQNMSGDPEQAYFSDGITDDIITDLSRYDELFVIARHSSFTYRDTATTVEAVARELGVQYIAEGSVRRAGNRIRVTARLMDPWAGNELWAERYDRELTDIFEVQDEITAVIVNTLAGQITRQHYKRILTKSTDTIHAYDHVLKATEHALRVSPDDRDIARAELEKAIAADPGFARAHAILALTYLTEGNNFWVADPAASFRQAFEAARTAVATDIRDPWGHAMLGIAELWHNRAHDRALNGMQRAVELNPGNAYFRGLYAYVLPFAGQAEKALEEIDTAFRMNPHFPAVFLGFRGRALLVLRRLDEALTSLQQLVTQTPGHSNALSLVAVAYVALGRMDEARDAVATLCASNPHYNLTTLRQHLPFTNPDDTAFIVDALASAGLPE